MRTRGISSVVLAGVATFVAGSSSAEVGKAVAVIQQAEASGEAGERILTVSAPVYMGDLITSGPVGEAQLLFVDETRLVVGPNSSLTIDEFIVQDQTVNRLAINTVVGSFRFITGLSAKSAYSLRTPNATLGIRGTALDITTGPAMTGVVVYSGAADVCDLSGQCVTVEAGCGAALVTPQSIVGIEGDQKSVFLASFPYAVEQGGLLSDFQVETSACGLVPALQVPIPIDLEVSPDNPGAVQAEGSPT